MRRLRRHGPPRDEQGTRNGAAVFAASYDVPATTTRARARRVPATTPRDEEDVIERPGVVILPAS